MSIVELCYCCSFSVRGGIILRDRHGSKDIDREEDEKEKVNKLSRLKKFKSYLEDLEGQNLESMFEDLMEKARENRLSRDRVAEKLNLDEEGKITSKEIQKIKKKEFVSIQSLKDYDLVFHVPAVSYITYRGIRTEAILALKREIRRLERDLSEDEEES